MIVTIIIVKNMANIFVIINTVNYMINHIFDNTDDTADDSILSLNTIVNNEVASL